MRFESETRIGKRGTLAVRLWRLELRKIRVGELEWENYGDRCENPQLGVPNYRRAEAESRCDDGGNQPVPGSRANRMGRVGHQEGCRHGHKVKHDDACDRERRGQDDPGGPGEPPERGECRRETGGDDAEGRDDGGPVICTAASAMVARPAGQPTGSPRAGRSGPRRGRRARRRGSRTSLAAPSAAGRSAAASDRHRRSSRWRARPGRPPPPRPSAASAATASHRRRLTSTRSAERARSRNGAVLPTIHTGAASRASRGARCPTMHLKTRNL